MIASYEQFNQPILLSNQISLKLRNKKNAQQTTVHQHFNFNFFYEPNYIYKL